MPCARCGVSVEDHLPGKFDHAFVDDDPDADIKLERSPAPTMPVERCWVCNAPDGRKIEATLKNRHLCNECVDALVDLALGLRSRLGMFACDAKYKADFAAKSLDNL